MKPIALVLSIWITIDVIKSDAVFTNTAESNQRKDFEELCKDQSVYLNFSNVDFERIGDEFIVSSIVTCLSLRGIKNRVITSSAFDKLPNLKFLDVSDNNWYLDQFLKNTGHQKLKSLVLDSTYERNYNDIIYHGIYINSSFPALEKLYLRNNELEYLAGGSFAIFSQLTHLYLSNNNILKIFFSEEYVHLKNQSYSDITYFNSITNNLTWLPQSLKHLDLDNNNLDSLDLINMNNLKFLSVKNNNLQNIELKKLKSLKYVFLNENKLQSVSMDMFYETPKVEYLNLEKNEITEFDGRIVELMPALQNLNLDFSNLNTVPEIFQAINLRNLSLRCNKITQLQQTSFNGMSQLQVLRLNNNKILNIESGTFDQLKNLEILLLGRNNLTNLPNKWMINLKKLQSLHLEENEFTNLEDLELNDSPTLTKLFLQNNPLKLLSVHSLDSAPENVNIVLDSSLAPEQDC